MITMNMYKIIQKYKVQGLNISEIQRKTAICRNTVKKYFRMKEADYLKYLDKLAKRTKVFAPFNDEIIELWELNKDSGVAVSSIFDVLEEQYERLPGTERTLRNYMRYLEETGALVNDKPLRFYTPVNELPFGKQLQVDFGQLKIASGIIIYIYAAVLSASRYRYLAVQERPFKTMDVIMHTLNCFQFIGGRPEEVVIDQDRLMVVSENAGDIRYTESFKRFIDEQELAMRVCRKADPESKGKVENLVKFVKVNFFSARTFHSLQEIQAKLPLWLARRANGKISQATKKIPAALLPLEQEALRPLRSSIFQKDSILERDTRIADEKGLISVFGNKYSVPAAFRGRKVDIYTTSEELFIYSTDTQEQIAAHILNPLTGQTIINKAHQYSKRQTQQELLNELIAYYSLVEWQEFVSRNYSKYKRYFREQHAALSRFFTEQREEEVVKQAASYCLELELVSAGNLKDAYQYFYEVKNSNQPDILGQLKPGLKTLIPGKPDVRVEKRPVSFYSSLVSILGGLIV